jgi:putative pyruvate formate lyase activating enzyme
MKELDEKGTRKQNKKLDKIGLALDALAGHEANCKLCPRNCGANRKKGEEGYCQSSNKILLSHAILHFGEEPILSGHQDCAEDAHDHHPRFGSGAMFFSGCSLKCNFCQNYQLSWFNQGKHVTEQELASRMLELQEKGALNINLVTPTHLIIPVLKALQTAYAQGLKLPIVYNSSGYEKAEIMSCLDGIVDIYLPDLKFFSPLLAKRLSRAENYFSFVSRAIFEMNRQQPVLINNSQDITQQGLIIRHLILPGQTEDSLQILDWLAQNISTQISLSLMSQYWPCFRAPKDLQRILHPQEYKKVLDHALGLGFERLFYQPIPFKEADHRLPDFERENPFDWT